jgi:hypothetical protein
MNKPNISYSLLKDYQEYWDTRILGCGLYLFKKHYQKLPIPQGDAAKLGTYFEYLCTGYVRPNDPIPEPEMVYKGKANEKMAADYVRANESAEFYKRIISAYGINILEVGTYMKHDDCSGILDIFAEWKGKKVIIDIKYSGLIDDKFSPYGWAIESLVDRPALTIQPLHYKYLYNKIHNIENIDFYFFVFSTKDSKKAKIIHINVDESANYRHEMLIGKIKGYINRDYDKRDEYATSMEVDYSLNYNKLVARPSLSKCLDCPYFDSCEKHIDVPLVEEINIF